MLKPKDREERIKTYNGILATLATQIKEQQISKSNLEKEITVIDEQFPPYEVVQQEKIKMDGLVNSHKSLKMNTFQIGEKEAYIEQLDDEVAQLRYLVDAPLDDAYKIRIAREKLGMCFPDEIIIHTDIE